MPSLQHRAAVAVVRAARLKRYFASEAGVLESVAKSRPRDARRRAVPAKFRRSATVTTSTSAGFPIVTIAERSATRGSLVWIHGGAYVGELHSIHWRFAAWAAKELGVAVHVPLYPLAPEHTWHDTIPSLSARCEDLARRGPLVLAGDSAGGGLALAVTQRLVANGSSPSALVLVSPWLDATADDDEVHALASTDPLLSVPGLLAAGRMWAGDDDPGIAEVSPLHGALEGLPPTMVLTGTLDLLNVDANRFATKARASSVDVELVEERGLLHDYALFPIPEGRRALGQIGHFVGRHLAQD